MCIRVLKQEIPHRRIRRDYSMQKRCLIPFIHSVHYLANSDLINQGWQSFRFPFGLSLNQNCKGVIHDAVVGFD